MSLQVEAGLHIVQAETADLGSVAQLVTEGAIWRAAVIGIETWSTDYSFNLALAKQAFKGGNVYLGMVEDEPAASMFLGEANDYDRLIWGKLADDGEASYVHKLAVGIEHRGSGHSAGMLKAAGRIAADEGKSLLRLDCGFGGKFAALYDHYRRQGFEPRDRVRQGCCTTTALLERVVDLSS